MSGPSARRRQRVGGGQTNSETIGSGRFETHRPHTTGTTDCLSTTRSEQAAPPVFGRCRDGSYLSSKGLVTAVDRFSPLSARTKMGIIASLHAEKTIMQPIWTRVTTTPFHPRHRVLQGNGRDMSSCSVSFDAPDFFHIPHVMKHRPHPSKGSFTDVKAPIGAQSVGSTAESPDMPAYMAVPGIDTFWKGYNRRRGDPHHKLIFFRNQTLFEPVIKDSRPPISVFESQPQGQQA